jgi:hypothetical protein
MRIIRLAAASIWVAGAALAQDADLTILVDGAMLDHGGLVEVRALEVPGLVAVQQTITLTDRFARVTLRYPEGASYNFRFRPVPSAMTRAGIDGFLTDLLTIGGRTDYEGDVAVEYDTQDIRVFPFAEYAGEGSAERVTAAWGETEGYVDVPPADEWGARALQGVFDFGGEAPSVGLICRDQDSVTICTPDPADALLLEAQWWRSIAEGRLERLRFEALNDCYDSGGLFNRPEMCEGVAGDGWPEYVPAE